MSRKKAREIALHLVFEMGFQAFQADEILADRLDECIMQSIGGEIELYAGKLDPSQISYIMSVVKGVAAHLPELDAQIAANAKGWNINRISKMTIAVLRLALYEIQYEEDVPLGAAINEAVELAKIYESDEAGAFVNGILGTVGRELAAKETP